MRSVGVGTVGDINIKGGTMTAQSGGDSILTREDQDL